MLILNLIAVLVVAGAIYLANSYYEFKKMVAAAPNVGSIPPHFLWGNLPEIKVPPTGDMLSSITEISKHANKDGLLNFFIFHQPAFWALKSDDVKKILSQSVYRREIPQMAKHMKAFSGERAIILLMGEDWKFHRRIMSKTFQYTQFPTMVSDMTKLTSKLVEYLSSYGPKREIEMMSTIKCLTMDIIGITAFGYEFQNVDNLGKKSNIAAQAFEFLLGELSSRTYSRNPFDSYYWLPTDRNRKYKQYKKIMDGIIRNIIEQRKNIPEEEQHEDFLKYLSTLKDDESGKQFSEQDTLDETLILLFGGFDTTAILLTYTLYLLSTNPHVEKKLVEEINTVLEGRTPTFDDVNKLTYTSAILKEGLRLYPPAPLTTRTLTQDITLSGHTFKAGTHAWIPIWNVHRFEENYKNAETFYPERFIENPELIQFAFSSGPRNCAGSKFALVEGTVILAMLYQKLTFQLAVGYQLKHEHVGVVQVPRGGLPMTVQVRS